MNDYEKRQRRNRLHTFLVIFVITLLIIITLLVLVLVFMQMSQDKKQAGQPATEAALQTEYANAYETPTESATEVSVTEAALPEPGTRKDFTDFVETDIYTFMQGPKAWAAKVDFSGSWCEVVLADQEFSVFGCGLCVLANIYSTLTECDCSPLDMYDYARQVSGYAPSSGYGAIDWPFMKQTLQTVGIEAKLRKKNISYRQFQEAIANSYCAVVLVSSYNDDTYWHEVEGHYVTIWLYDPEDDTVFLSDSGNPDHNRQRIPLRYIYDALKTAGSHQYMMITGVDENGNTWGHDGISIKWKRPKYYKKMGKY